MRFVIFYNHHPKIQDYVVRAWDNRTLCYDEQGRTKELTHPDFIRRAKINPEDVSMVGDVVYNQKTKHWEFDRTRPVIFFKSDNNLKKAQEQKVLQAIQEKYGNDAEAINLSINEQQVHQLYQKNRQLNIG
ncbi:MAG: hypothetical protein E7014_05655 [Alphaproteobacteria bacterium]|nr:hypothetical protein [Alphaproteobacteria bacterium]